MYAQNRSGRRFLTKEGKELKESWGWQAKSLKNQFYASGTHIKVTVRLYFRDARRRDSQNFLKLVYDAFTGILYEDDSQIVEEHIFKYIDRTSPRIELEWEVVK